jgi:hypothetical protein
VCERIQLPGGGVAIICGLRGSKPKFCACGRPAKFECDWKVSKDVRKSGTCDAPICAQHAKEVAPGKHLCPLHQKHYDGWKARHPEKVIPGAEQRGLFEEAA